MHFDYTPLKTHKNFQKMLVENFHDEKCYITAHITYSKIIQIFNLEEKSRKYIMPCYFRPILSQTQR